MVSSNLSISTRCNELLLEYITELERNNIQYNKSETCEINPVPSDIADDVLGQSVYQALPLRGLPVEPDNLQSCHRLRKKNQVILKFKCKKQKHRVLYKIKVLILMQLIFFGKAICK